MKKNLVTKMKNEQSIRIRKSKKIWLGRRKQDRRREGGKREAV